MYLLYADNSTIQQCSNKILVREDNLNYDHLLKEWPKQWLLAFVPLKKNRSCIFNFKNVKKFSNLLFDDSALDYVSQYNHLGVLFYNQI